MQTEDGKGSIKVILICYILIFIGSVTSLVLVFTVGKLNVNDGVLIVGAGSHPYMIMKYQEGQSRCRIVVGMGCGASVTASLIGIILSIALNRALKDSSKVSQKQINNYINFIYLTAAISAMGLLVSFCLLMSIKIQLQTQDNVGQWVCLIILSLCLILSLIIVVIVLVLRNKMIEKSTVQEIKEKGSQKKEQKDEKIDHQVFFITHNPRPINHQSVANVASKKRVNIKHTRPHEQIIERLKAIKNQRSKQNIEIKQIKQVTLTKEPLLKNQAFKQCDFIGDGQSESSSAPDYPFSMNKSQSYKIKVPPLRMDLIKTPQNNVKNTSFPLNFSDISQIQPKNKLDVESVIKNSKVSYNEGKSIFNFDTVPEQRQKRKPKFDLSNFRCNPKKETDALSVVVFEQYEA